MGTTPKAVTQDIVKEGKEASMEVHQDEEFFNFGIPEFIGTASVASTIQNLFYLSEKKTNTKTAIQNIAMDTAVKSPGMWMGAKIGAAILGPIGAIAGMVGGAIVAGGFLDELKVDYPNSEKIKTIDNFFENNNQIGIPHYFLKKESKLLLDSSEKLINAMKKRGI